MNTIIEFRCIVNTFQVNGIVLKLTHAQVNCIEHSKEHVWELFFICWGVFLWIILWFRPGERAHV